MGLPSRDKPKARKLVRKIENLGFDENDVDAMLIRLREYAGAHRIFREVADFVAHSDKRHAGLVRDSLRALHLSMRFFQEYVSPKRSLDLSQPFPSYVSELMRYEVDKCDVADLASKFSVSPERLTSRLEKAFAYDKARKLCTPKKPLSLPTLNAIRYLLSAIRSKPTFTADQFVDDFIQVLVENGLVHEDAAVRAASDRLILCVVLLMHSTQYSYGGGEPGGCSISCGRPGIPFGPTSVPLERVDLGGFECLQVNGHVSTKVDGRRVEFAFPVLTTGLRVSEWCDASLFVLDDIAHTLAEKHDHWYVWKFDEAAEFRIDGEFRLSRANEVRDKPVRDDPVPKSL
jgi:hypothetical protein